jgi:leucyl/phenylalanyl-tRNA--protein transferase
MHQSETFDWRELAEACVFTFPDPTDRPEELGDLVCIGADLSPETLLYAYSHGLFPMDIDIPGEQQEQLGWFSPVERAIFPLDALRITRSMKQSAKKYDVRIDTCFEDMMRLCMTVPRHSGWINERFIESYKKLHELGFAHSVEVFDDKELVGGLYGVGFAGFFAGESMVHTKRDASKVALMRLVEILRENGATLLDAQWLTDHLESLGAVAIHRSQYLQYLDKSLKIDSIDWPS